MATMINRNYIDSFVSTYLTTSISPTDTVISVNTTGGFPSPPFEFVIEYGTVNQELCLCTKSTTTAFTSFRGYDNSVAKAHAVAGSTVLIHPIVSAIDLLEMNTHTSIASLDEHPQYLLLARHNVPALHQVGTSIPTDVPSTSLIGSVASISSSTATAAANHVHGRETQDQFQDAISPVGMIQIWPNNQSIPLGWLPCLGQPVLISQFTQLYNLIGYAFGGTSDYYTLSPNQNSYTTTPDVRPPAGTEFYFNLPNIPAPEGVGQFCMIIKTDGMVHASPINPPPPPKTSKITANPRYIILPEKDFGLKILPYTPYRGPLGYFQNFRLIEGEIVVSYTLSYSVYQYTGPQSLTRNLLPLPPSLRIHIHPSEYINPYNL